MAKPEERSDEALTPCYMPCWAVSNQACKHMDVRACGQTALLIKSIKNDTGIPLYLSMGL